MRKKYLTMVIFFQLLFMAIYIYGSVDLVYAESNRNYYIDDHGADYFLRGSLNEYEEPNGYDEDVIYEHNYEEISDCRECQQNEIPHPLNDFYEDIFMHRVVLDNDYHQGYIILRLRVYLNQENNLLATEVLSATLHLSSNDTSLNIPLLISSILALLVGSGFLLIPVLFERNKSKTPGYIQLVGYPGLEEGSKLKIGEYDWHVIELTDEYALVLCDKVIDAAPFNERKGTTTWEKSSIRLRTLKLLKAKLGFSSDMDISDAISFLNIQKFRDLKNSEKNRDSYEISLLEALDWKDDPTDWWLSSPIAKNEKFDNSYYVTKDGKEKTDYDINKSCRGIRPVLRMKFKNLPQNAENKENQDEFEFVQSNELDKYL